MKIYTLLLPLALLTLFSNLSISQCTLNLTSSVDSVLCGECVTLSAYGYMNGNIAFEENFNSGSPVGWQFTQSVTIANNTCGVPSPDGSNFMWMGDAAVNPRDMTTNPIDLSLGGVICFEMRYAIQGDPSPCEGPDEPTEGVHLQYSTDNGTTWIDIDYWDPNGGNDPSLTSWNQYCVSIPPGAQTSTTLIQWHQDNVSGAEYDHWGIDNVQITLNDPNSQITWMHDNYSYPMGSGGGDDPTPVCISTETSYTAQITNGTNTCTQTITVPVKMPVIQVNAGSDVDICPGDCVDLSGEAKVIISPAKTPTYENNELSLVTSGHAEVNINVQDLNMQTIASGSITQVCINGFNFSGTQVCTNFSGCNCNGTQISAGSSCNLDESSFNVILTTPNGCSITLVPVGVAGGSYGTVCFVPSGGSNINGGGFPGNGSWNPNEPFSNLDGCTSNGVWTLEFDAPGGLGFGAGTLNGWSITFDDPEISYPAPYSWSPTTNMTNDNTLTPTVCPTTTTTYTLSATDSNSCATASDDVTVNILSSCCNFDISANITAPTCGNSDGAIDLTITNGSGNYSFDWGTNGTTEDLSNLPSGLYSVTITDITDGCSKDTSITLSTNAYTYVVNTTNPTCGNSDGSIEIVVTGGTSPIQYSIDNGVNFSTTNVFNNIGAGTYDIIINDGASCQEVTTATLTEDCCNFSITAILTQPSCGANDGAIDITIQNGSGNETFDWGANGTTEDLSNIGSGTYNLTVSDATSGCSKDTSFILQSSAFTYTTEITNPSCGNNNGAIILHTLGGTSPFVFSIDNGVTTSNDSVFSNLSAGTYDIVVIDGSGCQLSSQEALTDGGGLSASVAVTDLICNGDNSGRITITPNGGTSPYTYSIGNGTQNIAVFDNISAGTYPVNVTDNSGCSFDTTVIVNEPIGMNLSLSIITQPTCSYSCDGSVVTVVTGGAIAGEAQYQWSAPIDNNTTNTADNLCPGTYSLTVTDDNGCTKDTTFTMVAPEGIVADFKFTPQPTTVLNTEITLTENSNNATVFTWLMNGNEIGMGTTLTYEFPNDTAGVYNTCLVATNDLNCSDTICHDVIIGEEFYFFIPNTFTPDGDGDNDFFFPKGLGIENVEYELLIFNRWGDIIWRSQTTNGMWDGTENNSGKVCQEGVYVWKLKTINKGRKNIEKIGHVNLIR